MRNLRQVQRPLFGLCLVSFCAFALILFAAARGELTLAPTRGLSPSVISQSLLPTQTLVCPFWRTDDGFGSTIRIKNSLVTGPLDVVPTLYMADGTEYDLPTVRLPTAGIANVDVNAALETAPSSVREHLSKYGSAAIRYAYGTPGEVSATMELLNAPKSLIFVFPFGMWNATAPKLNGLEGLWWKRDPGVEAFLALCNTTAHVLSFALHVSGSDGATAPARSVSLAPHQVHLVKFEDVIAELPRGQDESGGIRIEYQGAASDLIAAGGLENEKEGYSAVMPFLMDETGAAQPAQRSYASVGVLVGAPDSNAGFPAGTRFTPYTVLRNTTGKSLRVRILLDYAMNNQPTDVPLPDEYLHPGQAKTVNLESLLAAAGLGSFNGSINLAFAYLGRPGDLLIATGSVDQTGTYVFEVAPQGVRSSLGKVLTYWTVAEGYDTMIALWNPLDAAEDVTATFYYGDGSGRYALPIHLAARASSSFTMGDLIRSRKPDPNGSMIPLSVEEGSATLESSKSKLDPMTLILSAAPFNVRTATCGGGRCIPCAGVASITGSPSPFVCPVNKSMQLTATAKYNDGTTSDVTSSASWSSNNTALATVGTGATNPGLVTGVSPGSVTISASLDAVEGGVCPLPPTFDGGCAAVIFALTDNGGVTPTVGVSCTPTDLAFGPTAPGSTTTGSCSTTTSPAGGTFSWSVNTNTVTLSSTTASAISYTSANPSTSQGDTTITVTYTVNSQPATAQSGPITVHKPTSLLVLSDTTNPTGTTCKVTCLNGSSGCTYSSYLRTRTYSVLDQFNQTYSSVGVSAIAGTESFSGLASSCGAGPPAVGTATGSTFQDNFSFCSTACLAGGPGCTSSATQTIDVDGLAVRTEAINWTCTGVTLSP